MKAVVIVIMGALVFVAALAWNETLRSSTEDLISEPYGKFLYPIIATGILIVGAIMVSKMFPGLVDYL